jgi:hypothetical protein
MSGFDRAQPFGKDMAEHHLEASGQPASPPGTGAQDGRAGPRCVVVLRVGVLVRAGESRQLCLVRNVSAGGMMIRAFSPVAPDEPVTVELRADRPLSGRIAWSRDGDAGIRFDRPAGRAPFPVAAHLVTMGATRAWQRGAR